MKAFRIAGIWSLAAFSLVLSALLCFAVSQPFFERSATFGVAQDILVVLAWFGLARFAQRRIATSPSPLTWTLVCIAIAGLAVLTTWGSFFSALQAYHSITGVTLVLFVPLVYLGWLCMKLALNNARRLGSSWRIVSTHSSAQS